MAKTGKNESGQALVIVLVIMLFGAMVMSTLLGYLVTSVRASGVAEDRVNAYYAADAGLELVISDLVEDGDLGIVVPGEYSWSGDPLNGYGEPTIYVTDDIPSPAPEPEYVVGYSDYVVTSTVGGVTITCYARYNISLWGNFVTIISWETL